MRFNCQLTLPWMVSMKTLIKEANWQEKTRMSFTDDGLANIVTNVLWQDDDAFIDTNSKFLFKMVCTNYFSNPNNKLTLTLEGEVGFYFSDAYRFYVYNLIYKDLTGEDIKNDILEPKDSEALFYQVMLEYFDTDHLERLLKIIQILEIDFKKESDKYGRVLFKKKKKKNFELRDCRKSAGQ